MRNDLIMPAVLCGGSGTRLWPLSRAAKPKQFQPLVSDESLLRETIARGAIVTDAAPIIIAGESMRAIVQHDAPAGADVVLEPEGRNTAPAAALAALAALERHADAIVMMMPSDHYVGDPAAFAEAMHKGARLAVEDRLVTFGIKPDGPNTGLGYITAGAPLGDGFHVDQFIEKPPLERAKALVASGAATWNAGIYMFSARFFLEELRRLAPAMHAQVQTAWDRGARDGAVRLLDHAAWADCPSDSIDYAVAEKTDRRAVVPVDMAWNDVGQWAALHEIAAARPDENVLLGDVLAIESQGCYVRADGRLVAMVGVEDLVIVDTPDALLVLPRHRTQDVKKIVEALKAKGRVDLL